MHNQKNFNRYSKEDLDNKKQRINNITKFQISSYLYNMISFDIKKSIMNDIISEFKNYYDLNKDIVDEFNKIIDNNNNINNNFNINENNN